MCFGPVSRADLRSRVSVSELTAELVPGVPCDSDSPHDLARFWHAVARPLVRAAACTMLQAVTIFWTSRSLSSAVSDE